MITGARQCEITRSRASEALEALAELQRAPGADLLQPDMCELQLDALRGTLQDLEGELAEYDIGLRSEGTECV